MNYFTTDEEEAGEANYLPACITGCEPNETEAAPPCVAATKPRASRLLIALIAVALTTQAHASVARGEHGHHGATLGSTASAHAAATGMVGAPAAQSGNGSRYSLVDDFQPWPQAEMAQFQKPKFIPYAGE